MEEVIKYLKELPEEKWETMINKSWNVKDVIAHLIAWNYEAASEIVKCFKSGGEPWFLNAGNFDDFNADAVERYKNFSKTELLTELQKSDAEVDEAVERCGRENLVERPGFKWLFDKGERKPHSIQHLEKIKEVIERNK